MKIFRDITLLLLAGMLCAGCSTVSRNRQKALGSPLLNTADEETIQDAASALTAVTGSLSDKEISQQDLYQAAEQMKNDPEARTAVEAVSTAFDRTKVKVKYSPATGKRYSADMDVDPETGAKLLPVE